MKNLPNNHKVIDLCYGCDLRQACLSICLSLTVNTANTLKEPNPELLCCPWKKNQTKEQYLGSVFKTIDIFSTHCRRTTVSHFSEIGFYLFFPHTCWFIHSEYRNYIMTKTWFVKRCTKMPAMSQSCSSYSISAIHQSSWFFTYFFIDYFG